MDKGLLFFVIALVCLWLVLDQFYGGELITQFVVNIMPSAEKKGVYG